MKNFIPFVITILVIASIVAMIPLAFSQKQISKKLGTNAKSKINYV